MLKLPQLHTFRKLLGIGHRGRAVFVVGGGLQGGKAARRQGWLLVSITAILALLPSYLATLQPAQAAAGVSNLVNIQGKVTNSNGTNVTDGTYDFVFKLYNGASSSSTNTFTESWSSASLFAQTVSGTAPAAGGESVSYASDTNESSLKAGQFLWNTTKKEAVKIVSVNTAGTGGTITISPTAQAWANTDTITNKIYVKDGIFQVALNSLNADPAWGTTDFTQDTIYLGVNFNSDGEMKPRSQFTTVPYAFRAKSAAAVDGLSVTSGKTLTVSNSLTLAGTDGKTLNIGGNNLTFTTSGATSLTLPTTGTLATLAGSEALTNKTINGLSITSTTGTLTVAAGKTLTANNSIALSGTDGIAVNFGGNNLTLTTSGATSLTLPTSGTVCVTSTGCNQANTNTGSGSAGQITYYTGTNTQAGSNSLFWATGTSRLGVNTAGSPGATLDVSSSETTANAAQINANSLTTGQGLSIASTSTNLTTGGLLGLSWTPGSATTMTGDLFSINVGPNGTVGNILNLMNDGLSVFSVSQSLITANVPVAFNAPGDFNLANGLYFSNTTQANISSAAPIQIASGEAFNSSNLTLSTYNNGMVVLDTATTTTNGKLGIGTSSPTGQLHIKGTLSTALSGTIAVTNASAAVVGTSTSFTTALNAGDAIGINGVAYTVSSITDNTHLTLTATYAGSTASGLTAYSDGTALAIDNGAGTNNLTFTKSGRLGLGTSSPNNKLQVAGLINFDDVKQSTYIGNSIGGTSTGSGNTGLGFQPFYFNTTGYSNTAIGNSALLNNTTGYENSGLGYGALQGNTTGHSNVGVGLYTNYTNATGSFNTAVGEWALYSNTNMSNNTGLGYSAGFNNVSGTGNLFLGYNAGYNETGSNKLYIANSSTSSPLIYGDFSAGSLTFNGNVTVGSGKTIQGLSITNNGTNTLNIAGGKILTASNTLTLTGTDGSSVNFGTGGTVCYTSTGCNAANTNTGSGSAGQIAFYTGTNTQSSDSNLVWDNSNKRLGIGATPLSKLDVNGGVAIGSYAGTAAAPSNGLIVSGQVGIGTNSPNASLAIAPSAPNVTGSELVTNGTFNTDASGWTLGDCASWSAGTVSVSYNGVCNNPDASTTFSVTAGKTYQVQFTLTESGDQVYYFTSLNRITSNAYNAGTFTAYYYAATSGTETIDFENYNWNSGSNWTLDNVSIKQTDALPAISVKGYDGSTYLTLGGGITSNTALGKDSLQSGGGSNNTALGAGSLSSSVTGVGNSAFGSGALQLNTSGFYNVALGSYALYNNTTGSYNIAIGRASQDSMSTGTYNVSIGDASLWSNNASQNVAIGIRAGLNNASGSGNVFLGYQAGYNELGSNKLYIANSNTSSPLIFGDFAAGSLTFNGNVTVASGKTINGLTITATGTKTLTIASGKTLTASNSLTLTGTDGSSVAFGGGGTVCYTSSGCNAANTNTGAGAAGQVAFYTGTNTQSSDSNLVWDNTNKRLGIGDTPAQALDVNGKIAINGTAIAYLPNQTNFVGTLVIGDGGGSLSHSSGTQGQGNMVVGIGAGTALTTGYYNTAIGNQALSAATNPSANTAVGKGALQFTTSGSDNTATGLGTLQSNTTGSANTAFGEGGLFSIKPTGSITAFAANGGATTVTSTAHGLQNGMFVDISGTTNYNGVFYTVSNVTANTFDINHAFVANDATGTWDAGNEGYGSYNTSLGYQAGFSNKTGTNNVFIGYQAGYNELGSNKLYIDISNTSSPLIFGDFSARALTFNGNVTVASGKTINGLTITSAGTKTLTIANGKTLTANNSLTLAGTDGKTLTVNNSITFGGTDSTSFTLPTANDTLAGIAATQTLTNKTIGNTGITFAGATSPGTSAAGTGRIYYDSATNRFMASENGGSYINLLGGYNKTITMSPEYAGATLSADGSGTTNGAMTSDTDSANGYRNYYQWTSTQAALQDYTVVVRATLPQDFGSWQSTGVTLDYKTGTATATDNAIDLTLSNTSASTIYSTTGLNNTAWTTLSVASGSLTGATPWNSAGATAVFRIKLKADSAASAKAMVGDITINYVSKF